MAGHPTWYDILGIGADADAEAIKAAWREATDKFEPGAGVSQFRLFNEAAEVLLDPVKRAAYDAELAAGDPEGGSAAEPDAEPEPASEPDAEPEPASAQEPESGLVADAAPDSPGGEEAARLLARPVLRWVAIPVLVASLVVIGMVLFTGTVLSGGLVGHEDGWDDAPDAQAAANRALTAALAFDYRHIEADRDRALGFMTPGFAEEFAKTYELLETGPDGEQGPVEKTKAVVTAEVLATGVSDAERGRVRVTVFVNQTSVKQGQDPRTFQNRLTATMVERDGAWLIDDIKTF